MEKIDREISERNLLFHQRPIHAFMELTKKIDPKGSFKMFSSETISPNDYSNDALCTQVNNWYESKYGDRIKIHMGPGSYILIIANEPWEVEYPLCFGRNEFVINSNLTRENHNIISSNDSKIPSINILCHVKDITQQVAKSLSQDEKNKILQEYMFGLNAVQSLRSLRNVPYMEQAMNDYDISVSNIFHKYPDYNNSKWASLQFAEKTMKAKLNTSGITFKKTHNLSKLAEEVKLAGFNIPDQIINNIQCSAGVRYGEVIVKKQEAILSVQSSLALFADIFEASAYEYERF